MAEEIVVGKEELIRKFRAMSQAAQGESLVGVARAGGFVILNAARQNIRDQGLIETRTLSRSLHEEVSERSSTRAAVDIGTNLVYAAIHEFGGTIRAKATKYLAIPVGNYTGSPRKYGDLRVRKTGAGNLVMVDAGGKVQYVLKKSVVIPAHPYMRPAYDEHKQDAIDDMGRAFKSVVMKAAG